MRTGVDADPAVRRLPPRHGRGETVNEQIVRYSMRERQQSGELAGCELLGRNAS